MTPLHTLLDQTWVHNLGWTLVQFLWQGTVISVAYAILRALVARSLTARARYAMACATLALMTAAPVATFLLRPTLALDAPLTAWPLPSPGAWEPLLPWLVAAWFTGAAIFSLRLLTGWSATTRLRTRGVRPAPPEWQQKLDRLIHQLRVSRPARLLVSSLVEVPTVVGWLRPVILMPVGALTGLPAAHIEALLAHELAHVRRRDYLVNILQSVAEAVLFYHPAVWWISGEIRTERELSCDDIAVAACGDALTYARALAELESQRPAHREPALAATGAPLLLRIRRLIGHPAGASHTLPGPGAALAMSVLWLAGIGAMVAHGAPVRPPSTPRPAVAQTMPAIQPSPPDPTPAPAPVEVSQARRPILNSLLFSPYGPAPRPQAAPAPQPEPASISGTATDAATGLPVKKVQVLLQNPSNRYGTMTDDAGKFSVEVEPGSYIVTAARIGYLSATFGAPDGLLSSTFRVNIEEGESRTDIDFKLRPQGVITGRVVNADGEPVPNIVVAPMTVRYAGGQRRLLPAGSQLTDERGEYRVFGLAPGTYYVSASGRAAAARSGERATSIATYYPGTLDPQSALTVTVASGRTTAGIDLTIVDARTTSVRGRVQNLTGITDTPISLTLTPASEFRSLSPTQATTGPDGRFELRGVLPGSYLLSAQMRRTTNHLLRASVPIVVGTDPLDNVAVTLTAGLNITGTVRLEPGSDASLGLHGISLRLGPSDGVIVAGNIPPTVQLAEDGGFTLQAINPERYRIMLNPMPAGYYIKSARIGPVDALETGLDLTQGAAGPLEIVLSPNGGSVNGVVRDDRDQPVSPAIVALIPDSPVRRTQSQWYGQTAVDASGTYSFTGLTPGDYHLVAVPRLLPGMLTDPAFLRQVDPQATKVTIREGRAETVDLKRIPQPE